MLIESTRIRNLLNSTAENAIDQGSGADAGKHGESLLNEPNHYGFSLNPIPALVIVLLGMIMSSHTQASMVSSMMHKQWGNLLLAGSLARVCTYALVFLKPPKSALPSRPPTELLAAFGLTSGGIIFMASVSSSFFSYSSIREVGQNLVRFGRDADEVCCRLVIPSRAWSVLI